MNWRSLTAEIDETDDDAEEEGDYDCIERDGEAWGDLWKFREGG